VADVLGEIERHVRCEACNLDFETDLQNAVELIFRVHPELRQADLKTYCIGGPEHAPHVVAQARLEPGESLELDLALDAGSYLIRGPQLPYTIPVTVRTEGGTTQAMLALSRAADRGVCPPVLAGRQRLIVENCYPHQMLLRVERAVPREDVLSAADAQRLPLFRQLFPQQLVERESLASLSSCTLLAIKVANAWGLLEARGEIEAQRIVQSYMKQARDTIETKRGQVAKAQHDRLIATFPTTLDAVACAKQVLALQGEDSDPALRPRAKVALHRGMASSTTVMGRVDVQGGAVHRVSALLDLPLDGELLLSSELGADLDVLDALWNDGWSVQPGSSGGSGGSSQAYFAARNGSSTGDTRAAAPMRETSH
jgi:class 3 adenylate cyclase